jgi:hypothetical protein
MTPPTNVKELIQLVGSFKYDEILDPKTQKPTGAVKIIGDWERKNIVLLTTPILNRKTNKFFRLQCHKTIKDNILEIFTEFKNNSYDSAYEIRMIGSFMPRHKLWNPKKSLSIHSYGLAIDINWDTNPVGKRGDMPDYVVDLFEKHGWTWGGRWKNPKDPMHWQYYTE